ncbi:MAG: DUF3500 domain-containing protein [Planctomycetales bacterium]
MSIPRSSECPDCQVPLDRRTFLRSVGGAALVGAAAPTLWNGATALAAPTPKSAAETAVVRFYNTLTAAQRETIAFPFDHDLRTKISANWHVTKPQVDDDFYSNEQRTLVDEIVRNVTSEEGYQRFQRQMTDDSGGPGNYSVAVFGTPGTGPFEWELTGRHLTLRADGDSVDQAAFGGPIVYGHGAEEPGKNLFFDQTKRVNEVFRALDAKQAARALVAEAPAESAVPVQGEKGTFPGLLIGELSADQKQLVEGTLKHLLAPYRKEDVDEVFAILKKGGGIDKLHLAFYQEGDLLEDKEWDIWRVEGPSFVWHFRGAPHVHAYINIAVKS